jgi:hypothetical protein
MSCSARRTALSAVLMSLTCVVSTLPLSAQDSASPKASPKAGSAARTVDPLAVQVDRAIDVSSRRFLTIEHHSPWQILHGVLALRQDFVINQPGGQPGQRVRALDWITRGASYRGTPLFRRTPHGAEAQPFTQPYEFEGHPNQFLAILTMSRLPVAHQFAVAGSPDQHKVSIAELLKHAQAKVNDLEEITWTLWALSHYLSPEARWVNAAGEPWSIERLVQIQSSEDLDEAACGGTHGLYALTYARNRYRDTHRGQIRGAWLEADQKIRRYIEEARTYQNEDGTFSASYFLGPHQSHQFQERVETSGHTLEWLVQGASDQQLRSDWMRRGVAAVAGDLNRHADTTVQCGPLYHALHGLVLYRERTRPAPTAPTTPAPAVSVTPTTSGK